VICAGSIIIIIIIIIIIFINCKWVDTHPVAVVISHITYARTMNVDYSRFSWGGLHGKYVVATGKRKTGTSPAVALGPRKTKKKPVSRWPVAGPSGY
jgi:hypothetical protein